MKKVLLVIAILIILLIISGILYLGYLGFIPSIAKFFGSDKPRDLGITWTEQDYTKAIEESRVKIVVESGEVKNPTASIVSFGFHTVKRSYSDKELSALITHNQNNWKYFPVSDVQVKISDGFGQVSGILHLSRLQGYAAATGVDADSIQIVMDKFKLLPESIPFYVSGELSVTDKIVTFNVTKAELGRMKVPTEYFTQYAGEINNFFTQQINAFLGFSIKKLTLTDGQLNFDGTLADTIKTYK